MYRILIIIYHASNKMPRKQGLLTQGDEKELVILCKSTQNPSWQFMVYVINVCSSNNLFIPECAPFLRNWLIAVACNNIPKARNGANDYTSPMSIALQPIYAWNLFILLGGHLLLSERKPTEFELCLLEALTTDLGISEGRKELVRAFISVHSGNALVNPSLLVIIFILQERKRNGVKAHMNAILVKGALNAIMTMFINEYITFWELREYMMILRTCESTPISRNQCTDAIITLLTGLYDGEVSPAAMNSIIEMLIDYIAANRPGANIDGALLALHIVPMIPVDNDALRVVQQEDATILAVDHPCIGTLLKASCDRIQRIHKGLVRQIGWWHMDEIYP
jgi:hypothetical protein